MRAVIVWHQVTQWCASCFQKLAKNTKNPVCMTASNPLASMPDVARKMCCQTDIIASFHRTGIS
ncbi:hypothetical protein D3C86_1736710 [compost metagenome]